MIQFRPISLQDKTEYERLAESRGYKGCEMSFSNLFLWGDQKISFVNGCMVFFSTFSRSFYPFPVGDGDKKTVIDEIIKDANERNIPLEITSVSEKERAILEELYPNEFVFNSNENSFDYVYDINNLADLPGKKYHKKRTHLNNFIKNHPNFRVEPFNSENLPNIIKMVNEWYAQKDGDFDYEKTVFGRAIENFESLELEGLALFDGDEVLAVTFASRMAQDTFDVHFEKARADVDGAYPVINSEFAKYIRNKYHEVKYLDREEDMGILGLRKAKQSYYPEFQVVKYVAKKKQR